MGGDGGQKDQGGAGVVADLGGTGCNYAEVPCPSEGAQKSAVEVVFVCWGVPVAQGNAEGSDSAPDSDP